VHCSVVSSFDGIERNTLIHAAYAPASHIDGTVEREKREETSNEMYK